MPPKPRRLTSTILEPRLGSSRSIVDGDRCAVSRHVRCTSVESRSNDVQTSYGAQVNRDGFRCSDKSRKRDQKQSSLYTEIGTVCELFSYISKDIAATTATTALTTITAVI